ncbi:HAD family hydrolase [Patescibacteria group bacterium]|nr:HAD family hydrolase [Patescibacteria group bacterium]
MTKIKLIIFDWDDVFTLGSKEGYFKCYHEALDGVGIQLDPVEEKKRILAKWGQPHREELRELLKEKPELLDQACKIYEEKLYGHTFIDQLSLVPGVIELLERLSQKYVLMVVTGLDRHIMNEKVIPKFGIPQVFKQIVTTHDIKDPKHYKPSPFVPAQMLKEYDIQPDEAIFVGDATNDVLMAQGAHISPVVVLTRAPQPRRGPKAWRQICNS